MCCNGGFGFHVCGIYDGINVNGVAKIGTLLSGKSWITSFLRQEGEDKGSALALQGLRKEGW